MSEDQGIAKPAGGPPSPRRHDLHTMLKVINGILVSVGALDLATESITVTIVGAVVALVLAVFATEIEAASTPNPTVKDVATTVGRGPRQRQIPSWSLLA